MKKTTKIRYADNDVEKIAEENDEITPRLTDVEKESKADEERIEVEKNMINKDCGGES